MGLFSKTKTIYMDNADSFSYLKVLKGLLDDPKSIKDFGHKENLGKELTFMIKVKSKTNALSNSGGKYGTLFKN